MSEHIQTHESDLENFKETVASGMVLVDFWAPWCAPCRAIAPHLDTLAKENPDLKVCKINVDDFPDLADELGVRAMPTLVLFKDGAELRRKAGALSKAALADFVAPAARE